MQSATRAEALAGIVEIQDGTVPIDESDPMSTTGVSLKLRREKLSQFPPLGPPDMLYLRKRYVPVVGAPKLYGYYHFVRGVAASSVAKISAYIVDVVRNIGLDPQSWVSTGGWEVSSATYVAYNIMARADLGVHVDFPGSTTAEAFGRDGSPIPITDLFWHQLHVSSVLRDLSNHGERPLYPTLRVISPSFSLSYEHAFLESAIQCAHTWHLSGSFSTEEPSLLAAKSRVATIVQKHFLGAARYEASVQFFSDKRLLQSDPLCAIHAAAAARCMGDFDRASKIVDQALNKMPQSDLALLERINIFRAKGELSKALETAALTSSIPSTDVIFRSAVADLYADMKQHTKAFHMLNRADMSPPPIDPFLHALLRPRNPETTPIEGAGNGTDFVRVFAKRLRDERNASSEKADVALSDLPAKLMQDADHACYAVLVKILNNVDWDTMLSIRGQCFVMETDIENGQVPDEDDDIGDTKGSATSNSPSESTSNGAAHLDSSPEQDANEDDARKETVVDERRRTLEKSGKKVCKPWLDYLVTNMYHDLRALAFWRAEEKEQASIAALSSVAKRSHSKTSEAGEPGDDERDVEAQVTDESFKRSVEDIVNSTKRPSVDWLRRGELAARLGKLEEARDAFFVCVKVSEGEKKICVTGLCRLMLIAAQDGNIKDTVRCADSVWNFMDSNTDRKSTSEPSPAVVDVRKALFTLISAKGLCAVREVLTEPGLDVDKKRLEGLLLDAVPLRVDGFSR